MFNDNDRLTRTQKGTRLCLASARRKDDALPRELRTLLLAVDEDTPYRLYREHLRSFGNIDSLFEQLHQEELVTRVA